MLRWEDSIRGHRFFVRACTRIVRLYLGLWDARRGRELREAAELHSAHLSDDERRAALKRQKKERAKEKKKAIAAEEEKKALGQTQLRTRHLLPPSAPPPQSSEEPRLSDS